MIDDLNCHYSNLPSVKAYDMENNIGFSDPFKDKPLDIGGQRTSLEWLKDQLESYYGDPSVCEITWNDLDELFKQAKSRYDDELMDKYSEGYDEGLYDSENK